MPNRTTPRFASTRIQYQPRPTFSSLPDINDDAITDGQVLVWDEATSEYIPADSSHSVA
jgi:hypothetical protein